jgi:hypothetical protein
LKNTVPYAAVSKVPGVSVAAIHGAKADTTRRRGSLFRFPIYKFRIRSQYAA